jgi:hypothetical protein
MSRIVAKIIKVDENHLKVLKKKRQEEKKHNNLSSGWEKITGC